MAKRKQHIEYRKCAECIHEYACQMWNIGNVNQMDATHCINYETVKDSSAYLCGLLDGKGKNRMTNQQVYTFPLIYRQSKQKTVNYSQRIMQRGVIQRSIEE